MEINFQIFFLGKAFFLKKAFPNFFPTEEAPYIFFPGERPPRFFSWFPPPIINGHTLSVCGLLACGLNVCTLPFGCNSAYIPRLGLDDITQSQKSLNSKILIIGAPVVYTLLVQGKSWNSIRSYLQEALIFYDHFTQ